jgi:hypothetical protein
MNEVTPCLPSELIASYLFENKLHIHTWLFVSHRNAYIHDGGIDHCIKSELSIGSDKKYDIILMVPGNPEHSSAIKICSIYLNGLFIGNCMIDGLASKLRKLNIKYLIIHSFIGFEKNAIYRFFISLSSLCKISLWIHDLSYFCDSQVLLRDDKFCGLLNIESQFCNGCEKQTSRIPLHEFYNRLLKIIDIIVFPSLEAKERFFNYFNLPSMSNIDYKILPHYQVTSKKNTQPAGYRNDMPICFSFFGHNVAHKGWFKFLNLIDALELTGKFKFFHIGTAHFSDDRVEHIPFSELEHEDPVDELGRLCMNHNIRLGFFWSTTLESFGMMLRQVLATQCAVLARGDDPALKEFIDDCDKIVYFDQFEDLVNFAMDENAVHDLLNKAANTVCSLKESEYSFSVLNNNYKKTNHELPADTR